MPNLPQKVTPGAQIKAATFNGLIDYCAAITPKAGPDVWPDFGSGGGVSHRMAPQRGNPSSKVIVPPGLPFTPYQSSNSAAQIVVRGGTIWRPPWSHYNEGTGSFPARPILISNSAPLTVANGDKLWLQLSAYPLTWEFGNGANWPNYFFWPLCQQVIVNSTTGVYTITFSGGYYGNASWPGGNLIIPEFPPMTLLPMGKDGSGNWQLQMVNIGQIFNAGQVIAPTEGNFSPVVSCRSTALGYYYYSPTLGLNGWVDSYDDPGDGFFFTFAFSDITIEGQGLLPVVYGTGLLLPVNPMLGLATTANNGASWSVTTCVVPPNRPRTISSGAEYGPSVGTNGTYLCMFDYVRNQLLAVWSMMPNQVSLDVGGTPTPFTITGTQP